MSGIVFENVHVGAAIAPLRIEIDRARLVQYAGASGDRNPIHWDQETARAVGLPDVIAHGMFTMGAAVEAVSAWAGHGGRVVLYQTKFPATVPVPRDGGAVIDVAGTVAKVDPEKRQVTVDLAVTSGGSKVLGRPLVIVQLD